MRSRHLVVGLLALGAAGAPGRPMNLKRQQKPFSFPLPNGFPNIPEGSATFAEIQKLAGGTLPNGVLPAQLPDVPAITLQLIAFNELFEVAFFSNLIDNITNGVPGYSISSSTANGITLDALQAIRAQEEIHVVGANRALAAAGRNQIRPCEYIFPVDNFDDAITFASTFTDVVLGTLQEALTNFAADGDISRLIAHAGAIIGQEGEQNGFFRSIGQPPRLPSSKPFLTASSGSFALSALQQLVIVPGSCPDTVPIPTFDALTVVTSNIGPQTQTIQFSFQSKQANLNTADLNLVYLNGGNLPVVEKPTDISVKNGLVQFSAPFPYNQYQMNGLTIAAVTNSAGPFASAGDVASATLFGPGLIEIN